MKQWVYAVMRGTTYFDLKLSKGISTCGDSRMIPNIENGPGRQFRLV